MPTNKNKNNNNKNKNNNNNIYYYYNEEKIHKMKTENISTTAGFSGIKPIHWSKILLGVGLYTVILITIVSNIVVLLVVFRIRRFHTVFNYYIANLAITDLAVAVVGMNLTAIETVLGYWPFGEIICSIRIFLNYAMTFASVFTLILIAVDRLWATSWRQHYRKYSKKKKARVGISCVWIVMLILWLPPCITDRLRNSRSNVCKWEPSQNKEFVIVVAAVGHHGSCLILLFCYIRVYLFMKQRLKIGAVGSRCITGARSDVNATCSGFPDTPPVIEVRRASETNHSADPVVPSDKMVPAESVSSLDLAQEPTVNKSFTSSPEQTSATNIYSTVQDEPLVTTNNLPYQNQGYSDSTDIQTSQQLNEKQAIRSETSIPRVQKTKLSIVKFLAVPDSKSLTSAFSSSDSHSFDSRNESGEQTERRERKVFLTLTYVIAGYIICWVPFHFVFDVSASNPKLVPEIVYTVTFWMTYLNSTINPFLYNFSSPDFRRAFRKLLRLK